MSPHGYLVGILFFPLAGAVACAGLSRRLAPRYLAWLASAAVALAFLAGLGALRGLAGGEGPLQVLLWTWGTDGRTGIELGLFGDALSLWFSLVITGVGLLIHVYSAGYMAGDPGYGRYFAQLNFFVFAMALLVLSDGFLGLIMGWAGVGLASYLLIGFWRQRPAAAAAARKAYWVNSPGEVGLILASALTFAHFGSLRFAEVFPRVPEASGGVTLAVALLLLLAAVAKSAQLPLQVWLPDAMQGPTPVSALIHAATMVTAGVYLVCRAHPFFEAAPAARAAVAAVGALSAFVGALVAVGQTDIKRVLAYSTMSQVGYMFLAAGVGAYGAALFHFLTHAFFKALLFLGAGVVIHFLGGEQDIRRMGGLGGRLPVAYWTFVVGTGALAGVPPLAGFFSKDEILLELFRHGHFLWWLLALAAAGLTAFYSFRLFTLVFAGAPGAARDGHHPPGLVMTVPVVLLAVLAAAGGWIAPLHLPQAFLGPLFPEPAASGAPLWANEGISLGLTLAVAAVGAVWALGTYRPGAAGRQRALAIREGGALARGLYFDDAYRVLWVRPLRAAADWVARVLEPVVIDGAVNGVARLAGGLAAGVRQLHSGYVRRYALTLFTGVVGLLLYYLMLP